MENEEKEENDEEEKQNKSKKTKKAKNEHDIKAILLGESGVGKTNLINVTIGHSFTENTSTTFSNSFVEKIFEINNIKYNIKLWDTIGQEKYRPLTKIFFKDSKIIILVYDKSIKKSFDELKYWALEVKNALGDNAIVGIAGNKYDLEDNEDDVDENKVREFAKSINAKFKMVSAKTNGIAFINFLQELLNDYIKKNNGKIEKDTDSVALNKKNHKNKIKNKKNKCC